MGRPVKRTYALIILFGLFIAACNPRSQLGVGVLADEVLSDVEGGGGLSFREGKILVSKAIQKDIFGSLGPEYCFDNSRDSKYGCVTQVAGSSIGGQQGSTPVFLTRIQLHFLTRSNMYGLSETSAADELEVSVPTAVLITAIPTINPDTGDFVFVRRKRFLFEGGNDPIELQSNLQVPCVPGVNGAVGFVDQPGYALTGLHVFEEGISYASSLNGMHAAKVEVESYSLSASSGSLAARANGEVVFGRYRGSTNPPGDALHAGPDLRVPDSVLAAESQNGVLPRAITGLCIRSIKRNDEHQLIRVGLFGLRGVFYKGRFR